MWLRQQERPLVPQLPLVALLSWDDPSWARADQMLTEELSAEAMDDRGGGAAAVVAAADLASAVDCDRGSMDRQCQICDGIVFSSAHRTMHHHLQQNRATFVADS